MADQASKLFEIKSGTWINPAAVAMAECVGGVKKFDPVTKDFTVWHEQQINFRADADNLFNNAFLGNPARLITDLSSSGFGNISNQSTPIRSNPRTMQLSVKYHF